MRQDVLLDEASTSYCAPQAEHISKVSEVTSLMLDGEMDIMDVLFLFLSGLCPSALSYQTQYGGKDRVFIL